MSANHPFDLVDRAQPSIPNRRKAAARTARVARAGKSGANVSSVPPLQWWRRLPADAFTAEHLSVLRRAVSGIGMVGEPRWADAVRGHGPAAVGVARRVMKERHPLTPVVDLTLSTVLIAAIAGDPAAIAVLVTMIERMGAAPEQDALKRSWRNRQSRTRNGHDTISSAVPGARPRPRMVSGD